MEMPPVTKVEVTSDNCVDSPLYEIESFQLQKHKLAI